MSNTKKRHTVWMTDEAWEQIVAHYKADNCSTQNEYIEKAVQFYSGYLDAEHADSYLPRVLADVLTGKLDDLGGRLSRHLFDLSVNDSLMASVIASAVDISPDDLRRLRVRSVKDVKELNGQLDLTAAVKREEMME